jgi:ADP-ribosyl-[dinitrogen reductase] hydrolase
LDRYLGCLMGLAVGDALGTTLEFKAPGSFEPLTDLVGGGPFNLEPGQWTDDTSMALCLVESLIEKKGFDPVDQLKRYVRWFRKGYLSSTGKCFDIGTTIRSALVHFEKTGAPYCEVDDPYAAGNGSIMRLAPVPMFYVVKSLEAALWAFHRSRSFREGALLSVNLSNDADTTGAVYGQIAGAFYGYGAIPREWKAKLSHRDLIEFYADRLYRLAYP